MIGMIVMKERKCHELPDVLMPLKLQVVKG
jgi:hypothetical protein